MKTILINEMKAIYHPDDWNYTDWLFSREDFNLDFIETLLMDDFKYQLNGITTFRLHGSNKKDFVSRFFLTYQFISPNIRYVKNNYSIAH